MPSEDAPEAIVARWLRQNNYENTLTSFLAEAGLPADAGSAAAGKIFSLEQILEEKRLYDQSLVYEKRTEPTKQTWTLPAPSIPKILDIPQPSNVLHVSIDHVIIDGSSSREQRLAVSMADRRLLETATHLHMDGVQTPEEYMQKIMIQDSPILSWTGVSDRSSNLHVGTTMSGKVVLHAHNESIPMIERTDHKRYCVKAALDTSDSSKWLLATIGWDSRLNIYEINRTSEAQISSLDPPYSSIDLPSIPEDILWIKNPSPAKDNNRILILTRRDSCLLHYYLPTSPTPVLLGTQNLAPHAISWTLFTPSTIALCPTDTTLLAVAISSLPHLRLILVRLLVPEASEDPHNISAANNAQTAVFDRRALLAVANRDEAAIVHNISTLAPQTPYSTPKVVWRPDGSGVWVNGDDGCVRGIEASSGKVVATLRGGHEEACKVRTLWAGYVSGDNDDNGGRPREEWVVSGGFDRRVVIWKVVADEK